MEGRQHSRSSASKNTMNGFQITPIMAVATRVDMMMGIMHTGVSWSIADAGLCGSTHAKPCGLVWGL